MQAKTGTILSRQDLIDYCKDNDPYCSEHTIDSIRRYYTAAGYLEDVYEDNRRQWGRYRVVKQPDLTMNKSQLLEEAYGYSS